MNAKTKNIVVSIIIVVAILVASALTGLFTAIGMGGIKFAPVDTLTSSSGSSTTAPDKDDQTTDAFLQNYDITNLQVTANAQKTDIVHGAAAFQAMTVTNGDTTMNYRIYIPANASYQKAPVLLFFHGAGESVGHCEEWGNKEPAEAYEGFNNLFKDTSNPVLNAIVIAAQCNGKTLNKTDKLNRWVTVDDWTNNPYSTNTIQESKQIDTVLKLLKYYDENDGIKVNRDQIYAMGMSMGGFATWDLLARHTDIFAAAIPICGGVDVTKASKLKDVPIYTFHGTADTVVYPTGTKQMVSALRAAGSSKLIYQEYAGAAHEIWNTAMATDGLMNWLFSHKLSDRSTVKTYGAEIELSFLGDSITEGVGASGSGWQPNPEYRYTTLIDNEAKYKVNNYGVGGTTIGTNPNWSSTEWWRDSAFTKRYKNISKTSEVIFVFGGTNDYGSSSGQEVPLGAMGDTAETSFYGALDLLINGLKRDYPKAKLCFITPINRFNSTWGFPSGDSNVFGKTLQDYRNAIIQKCQEQNIDCIDTSSLAFPASEFTDGLHPNQAGHIRLKNRILDYLTANNIK